MSAGSIVMLFRGLSVSSSPVRAAQNMFGVERLGEDQADEKVSDLGHAQGNEVAVAWMKAPFFDRVTVRKAWASTERVVGLYQPVY